MHRFFINNFRPEFTMKKYLIPAPIAVVCFFLFSALTAPDEGMWLLDQINKLPLASMQKHGLELTPEQIYNPDSTSLKDAIVLLGGGTSSFVSNDGLILTNHHVAFGAIQSVSSVQDDYLKNGFYAKTREEELSIPTYSARVLVSMKDVTAEILSAVNDAMSAAVRADTIKAKIVAVQKSAKGTTDYEYTVSETYNGVKYYLYGYEVLKDVRLVYAPPTAIGNYGGEVDNWYWPRHTGDFSFMRAYVGPDGKAAKYAKENVPYHPKVFLPFSAQGVREGSFAMIIGFPGRTFRYRTSMEVQLAKDETLPIMMEIFKKRMDIMETAGRKNRAVEIKFASRWRGLANTYKNYQGTLQGMKRSNLLDLRREEENKFLQYLHSNPEMEKKYGTVLSNITAAYQDYRSFSRKQIVLGQLLMGVDLLRIASQFNQLANSFTKDSTGKVGPPEAKVNDLKTFLTSAFKIVDIPVDKEILLALIKIGADLPTGQQIEAIQHVVGNKSGEERDQKIKEFIDDLYKESSLITPEDCNKFITKSADDIRDDEFVKFAMDLDKDNTPLQAQMTKFNVTIGQLRRTLLEAWMAWKGSDLYPDANRSMRFTYGEVKSYNPRDAVHYNYVTTLGGVMEKETGEEPFIVPPKLKQLWENRDFGKYADPNLNDVPVAFLANLDITGGNSGSPVINGRGELIGIAFDGNWEGVVGDYVFQEPLNRSINVDARYVLFILDKFSNAQNILKELVIK
jgi:hypothetical protein